MYGYPRGASGIVTVSPLWLFSWSLCDWTKMALLCCCDQGKWCGEEKPITLPNDRTQRCADSTQTQSAISPRSPYRSYLHPPPRRPAVGHWRPAWGSSEGENVVRKVINIGNVPAMWNRRAIKSQRNQMRFFFGALDSSGDGSVAGRLSQAQINKQPFSY